MFLGDPARITRICGDPPIYWCLDHDIQEDVEGVYQVSPTLPDSESLTATTYDRHFTPAWHLVIMGTGATSALIHNFPYGQGSPVIRIFTLIIFFLNFVLFVVVSVATAARYALFPDVWSKMLRHPAQSLFVGAAPMGFCTLINIAVVSGTYLLYFVGNLICAEYEPGNRLRWSGIPLFLVGVLVD